MAVIFFHTDSTAYSSAHFGQNNAVIIALGDVACTAYESRLIDCPYDSNTADCTHSQDVGVQCVARELHNYRYIYKLYHFCTIAVSSLLHRVLSWQHQTTKWFYSYKWEGGGVSEWRLGDSV